MTRILAQPVKRTCTLCAITDLLNTRPPVACSATSPCPTAFQVVNHPAPKCEIPEGQQVGTCTDPLRAAPVGIGPSTEGNSLRLVFSKRLDPNLNVQPDMMKPPVLADGIVEVADQNGAPLGFTAYYDPTGSAYTSDPIKIPFGPAIQIDLAVQPDPATTYTIKLHTAAIRDSRGQVPTDDGSPPQLLPALYTAAFTTRADISLMTVVPDVRAGLNPAQMKPSLAPDSVIQFSFNVPVADPAAMGSRATAVLKKGDTVIPTQMWLHAGRPGKPNETLPNQVNVVAVSHPGMPVALAPGQYSLTIGGLVDKKGKSTEFTASYVFFVVGEPNPADKNSAANFCLPMQPTPCM